MLEHREEITAYALLAPTLLISFAIIAYPVISAVDLSLQELRLTQVGRARRVWTPANYARLFADPEFWRAGWTTLKLVAVVVSGSLAVGLGTALVVNERFVGRKAARIAVALPWAIPAVMAAVIWWWMFDSSFGVINWFLVKLGVVAAPVAWFNRPGTAFAAIAAIMIWKGYPFMSVMLLAGLQAIPTELYEASKADGAGRIAQFRYVTLPALRPVMGIALILIILWVFREFPIIWLITGGGPIGATRTLAVATYETGFKFLRIGEAASLGVITLVISFALSALLIRRVESDAR